jgi:hypothetical protein
MAGKGADVEEPAPVAVGEETKRVLVPAAVILQVARFPGQQGASGERVDLAGNGLEVERRGGVRGRRPQAHVG